MRVLSLPARVRALVLDFDSTLYTNPAYASFQNDVLIERLARERGVDLHASDLAALDALWDEVKAGE